jgi:hypothetical protein
VSDFTIFDECGWAVFPLFRKHCHRRAKRVAFVEVRDDKGFTVKGKSLMATTMTDVQSFTLSAVAEDSTGAATTFGGTPTWAVAPPGALILTPAADGMSTKVANASPAVLGASTITLSAFGALPSGAADPADPITGTYAVTVVAGEASQVVFTATTPA